MGASEADGERVPDGGSRGGGVAAEAGAIVNGHGGRFVGSGTLTDKQAAFVAAFASNGGNATEAARQAGYASPLSEGYRLMQTPSVQTALDGAVWLTVTQDRGFCRDRARKIADDPAMPGDIKMRALDRLDQWANEAEARLAKRREMKEGGLLPIPDGSGRGEMGGIEALFAAFRVMPGDGVVTVDAQPIDMQQ